MIWVLTAGVVVIGFECFALKSEVRRLEEVAAKDRASAERFADALWERLSQLEDRLQRPARGPEDDL